MNSLKFINLNKFPIIPGYKTESDNNLSYFVIALYVTHY